MTERLGGKAAMVTGAGNGIGRAIAMLLAEHGAQVVVNDLGTDELGPGGEYHLARSVGRPGAACFRSGHVVHAAGGQIAVFNELREERAIYRGDHAQVDPWTLDELDHLFPRNLLPRP